MNCMCSFNMKEVTQKFFLLIGTIIFFTLIGCGEKKTDTKKEELIVAQEGEPKSLDIHKGNDGFSLRINKQIYSRLVESNGKMEVEPGLAESWKNIDEKTTQFKLRKGVKFHNGDDFTAKDVKFSFERMKNSPRISFVLPPIEKIEIIDKYTVNIVTVTPFAPLMAHLSHPALGIVSEKMVSQNPEALTLTPIGTGPYKFLEWKLGDRVILERNDNYFLKKSNFKKLIYKNIVEASNRVIGLETKEIDIALSISAVDQEMIKEHSELELLTKPSLSYNYIGFNMNKEKFKDIRVRKAINYAIDKQSIVDVVLNKGGKIATSPLAPSIFGFTNKTKAYEFDLKKAKALMKEAGLEKGFTTSIYVVNGEIDKQIAEIVQANLKEIGIELKILVTENSSYWDMTAKGNHDMFLGSWGCVTGDADYGLYSMYHSTAKGASGNRTFYSNSEVDKMLDQGKIEINKEKRKKLYEKIQLQIVEDAPEIMLFNRELAVGVQKNIKGFEVHPVTLHDFYPVFILN